MIDNYKSRDESDALFQNLLYSKLELFKLGIEGSFNVELKDIQNEIFYNNYLYDDPLIIAAESSLLSGGPIKGNNSEKAIELFGRAITRNSEKDTESWIKGFLGSKQVTFKCGSTSKTVWVTLHKRLVDPMCAALKEIGETGFIIKSYGDYCYRKINNPSHKGSATLSYHSYGVAIDINPVDNPFVKGGRPQSSGDDNTHIRTNNSDVVKILASHGFGWGGRYGDYMHFSAFNGG